jgi:hypothetical protein
MTIVTIAARESDGRRPSPEEETARLGTAGPPSPNDQPPLLRLRHPFLLPIMRVSASDRTLALATPIRYPSLSSTTGEEDRRAPPSGQTASSRASPAKATLTEHLARSPSTAPAKIRKSKAYLPKASWPRSLWVRFVSDGGSKVEIKRSRRSAKDKAEDRERARTCGDWGESEPSELFLDVSDPRSPFRHPQLVLGFPWPGSTRRLSPNRPHSSPLSAFI